MQAKAFKSACSCNPGFQVGCRFRAQLPQAIYTISAPSGSTVKIGFQILLSVCIIVSRGREKGKREERTGKMQGLEDTIPTWGSIQNEKLRAFRFAVSLLPVQYVPFSLSGFELWLSQVHLRPCVKYWQIKAQQPFTQQRDVPRKAGASPSPPVCSEQGKTQFCPSLHWGFFTSRGFLNADSFINNFLPFKNKAYLIPQNTPIALDYHSH